VRCRTCSILPVMLSATVTIDTGWRTSQHARYCECRDRYTIAHVAGGTRTIRVGSGGIMLPNHAPLIVAEQFGTLETLYPGASTSDWGALRERQLTSRGVATGLETNVEALRRMCTNCDISSKLRIRGRRSGRFRSGPERPLFILGSSVFGASVAATLGLPFAFASQFRARCSEGRTRSLPRSLQAFRQLNGRT